MRYEPGSHHPFHKHDFAQVWYILEGEFQIGETLHGPGHHALLSRSALRGAALHRHRGLMLFVQYQGPTTGGRPIYDGRFNMKERRAIAEENVER